MARKETFNFCFVINIVGRGFLHNWRMDPENLTSEETFIEIGEPARFINLQQALMIGEGYIHGETWEVFQLAATYISPPQYNPIQKTKPRIKKGN